MMRRRPTFDELHKEACAAAIDGEPPDIEQGASAQLIAVTLFDWIAANSDAAGRTTVATAIAEAFGWPEHGWPENDNAGPDGPALS